MNHLSFLNCTIAQPTAYAASRMTCVKWPIIFLNEIIQMMKSLLFNWCYINFYPESWCRYLSMYVMSASLCSSNQPLVTVVMQSSGVANFFEFFIWPKFWPAYLYISNYYNPVNKTLIDSKNKLKIFRLVLPVFRHSSWPKIHRRTLYSASFANSSFHTLKCSIHWTMINE